MGEARRRKKLDPNWGKQNKAKNKVEVKNTTSESNANPVNSSSSLIEYVKENTALKGRGYLVCMQGKCLYYGKEDYVGDEDALLKEYVSTYKMDTEVVLVRQLVPNEALFGTEIVPLESLSDLDK